MSMGVSAASPRARAARASRARACSAVQALAALGDGRLVRERRRRVGERGQGEPRRARERHVAVEAADRVAREERVHAHLDDLGLRARALEVRDTRARRTR